ncbi:hypothetical protein EMPG_11917, partial [Blastomyces silverae]
YASCGTRRRPDYYLVRTRGRETSTTFYLAKMLKAKNGGESKIRNKKEDRKKPGGRRKGITSRR